MIRVTDASARPACRARDTRRNGAEETPACKAAQGGG